MEKARGRFGGAELATLAGFIAVAVVVGLAVGSGWTVALIPGLAYALATAAAYLLYSHHRAAAARAAQPKAAALRLEERPAPAGQPHVSLRPAPVLFRVVDVRGSCPLGYGKGALVTVGTTGAVAPRLCAPAEAVLRLAAGESGEKASRWCCPIYDHLLVFQREGQAAGQAAAA